VRPIHVVHLDKSRPALLLTRELAIPYLNSITVAPITSTIKGLASEVRVGAANGLNQECVVSCDNVTTVPASAIGRQIGSLLVSQELELAAALLYAYDLDAPVR
jgi:mRNA interferase MazF